jgi:aspartyl-tRNA(Asn)/glutamyl-tRNA(Gln) amidotransferase subunit A
MTRSVADAALMMATLSLPDGRDHMSLPRQTIDWMQLERELKGLRIGLLLDDGIGPGIHPEVKAAVLEAARAFEAAGATVEPMRSWVQPGMLEGVGRFFGTRVRVDMAAMPLERRALMLPQVRRAAERTAELSAEDVYKAFAQILSLRAATVNATRGYDYALSPVSPVPPYAAEWTGSDPDAMEPLKDVFYTLPYNVSEQPAASVNCGYTAGGLPIGLQIAGRRFDDLGVLQMARAWEQMRPAQRTWPQPIAA